MATASIDSLRYYRMVQSGAAVLEQNREKINDLNVFPIPDGDTGDNMLMTINGGISETESGPDEIICDRISRGMLYGARGNSGVILSRFFHGLNSFLAGRNDNYTAADFIDGLAEGVKEAYSAVSHPQEGTMLTVMREMFENVEKKHFEMFDELFEELFYSAAESLRQTPEKLDVLKKAGVIDSGGAGFLCIIEGMKKEIEGIPASAASTDYGSHKASSKQNAPSKLNENDVLLGYCTEFILQLIGENKESFDFSSFKAHLTERGDSVVCFSEGDTVKVHIHTPDPGEILSYALHYGEFLTLKIENMTLQHSEMNVRNDFVIPEKKKKSGVLQVASGDGIKKMLADAGCDVTVDGGQSMNPSAKDICDGIRKVGADTVYVFPNNSNIILAAEQAAKMCDSCNAIIIPTKNIGQGYCALSVFDSDNDPQTQCDLFGEIIDCSTTLFVSMASRDCSMDGVNVKKDSFIGFSDGRVLCCDTDKDSAALSACDALGANRFDVGLVIYSENAEKENAEKLSAVLSDRYRNTEFIVSFGGQPVYDYIIIFN